MFDYGKKNLTMEEDFFDKGILEKLKENGKAWPFIHPPTS